MALDARIKETARAKSMPVGRCRQLCIFEAFIARVFDEMGSQVLVKGGVALELVLERARTTKDIDLRMVGDATEIERQLRAAGRRRLVGDDGNVVDDFLSFELRATELIKDFTAPYGGTRYVVDATLGGDSYGNPFGLDVGLADAVTGSIEIVTGNKTFAFVGIAPSRFRVYPRETHVAEKLHAYSVPRTRPNSRIRDLPDLALLSTRTFTAVTLRSAIDATFGQRETHAVPLALAAPPPEWAEPYAHLANRDSLPWPALADAYNRARSFLDPVLGGTTGEWDPDAAEWRARAG